MNTVPNIRQGRFYLLTVDILKGMAIFPMIFSHSVGWWDGDLARNYEGGSLAVVIIWVTGLMVFPCFLYLYGFNQVNSFLRRRDASNRNEFRSHAIKRSSIFFIFASLALILMSIIQAPEKLFNYLFSWHLLHLFSFSTLFLLLLWELAYWFEKRISVYWSYQQYFIIFLFLSFVTIIVLFIFFHDYTVVRERSSFPVNLDINSILEHIFLDISSCGIIPWLSFPIAGGITASLLNLPSFSKSNVLQKSKLLLFVNTLFLIIGLLCLRIERFISAGLGYASSFPHVLISIGLIGCIFVVLILTLDISQKIPQQTSLRILYPIIVVSKISLTVYLVHPVAGIFDPSLIPSESMLLFLVSLYGLFFIILAHFWQKWDFKFSFEWIVRKYS